MVKISPIRIICKLFPPIRKMYYPVNAFFFPQRMSGFSMGKIDFARRVEVKKVADETKGEDTYNYEFLNTGKTWEKPEGEFIINREDGGYAILISGDPNDSTSTWDPITLEQTTGKAKEQDLFRAVSRRVEIADAKRRKEGIWDSIPSWFKLFALIFAVTMFFWVFFKLGPNPDLFFTDKNILDYCAALYQQPVGTGI